MKRIFYSASTNAQNVDLVAFNPKQDAENMSLASIKKLPNNMI